MAIPLLPLLALACLGQGLAARSIPLDLPITLPLNTDASNVTCPPSFGYWELPDYDHVMDYISCANNVNVKTAARRCTDNDQCRSFSLDFKETMSCIKTAAGPAVIKKGACFYVKNPAVCERIEGYTFVVNQDRRGADLSCISGLDVRVAARSCTADAACKGFNLDFTMDHTCFKSAVSGVSFNNQVCFYTKVDGWQSADATEVCAPRAGYWLMVDANYFGSDLQCLDSDGSNLARFATDCAATPGCAAISYDAVNRRACTKAKGSPPEAASSTCLYVRDLPPSGERVLLGYGGAWIYNGNFHNPSKPHATIPPLDPSAIPLASGVETWVAMYPARDFKRDGAFFMGFGEPWTPLLVAAAKQGGRRFLASVGGDSFPWMDPVANSVTWAQWQDAATLSLITLINRFHLEGLDLKYEAAQGTAVRPDGTWTGFAENWCPVLRKLRVSWPALVVTLAPSSATLKAYKGLYTMCPDVISWINWQTYADPEGLANQQVSVERAAAAFGGIGKIAIGFVSDDTDAVTKRGTGTYADAVKLLGMYPDSRGAAVWAFENSRIRSFSLENQLYGQLRTSR